MKAVILAGGLGTRISEESHLRPKPMIEIGGKPILWHIMKEYSHYGVNEFIICAGYKQQVIKEWFSNYFLYNSDITFDFSKDDSFIVHKQCTEKWKVSIIDTGLQTMTGGRVKRIENYVKDETFFLTYGDAVSDVNINELLEFHNSNKRTMTITCVSISQQKGVLDLGDNGQISSFREKDDIDGAVINGGFMVCEPKIFEYLQDDTTVLEKAPMSELAKRGELMGYYHEGFWQCMDTKREKDLLEELWTGGKAPWKIWND